MKTTESLYQLGQSVWYDNIQRKLLLNGELAEMINNREIFGVTSNPSIFQNAIAKSSDYDTALKSMAWAGWKSDEIFWELAIEDIRAAADLFKPLYIETSGGDGYVSLEVNPLLAHDAEGTLKQALELWKKVGRENLMIKIPATKEGVVAIEKAIAAGLNVNVTLIFSLERYQEVIDAYLKGLEIRVAQGKPVNQIASVASFFVSRVDTKIDPKLQAIVDAGGPTSAKAAALLGKAAISNGKLAYEVFKKNFTQARFEKLSEDGARLQRPLWASTSTKNPAYRDVLYIEELVGSDTVNTIPPQTLKAFLDHGKTEMTVEKGLDSAKQILADLAGLGISMDEATLELENEGVKSFADAFSALLQTIDDRASAARQELGPLSASVVAESQKLAANSTVKRLFDVDPTLWTSDPAGQEEIRKRCNWLNAPWTSNEILVEYEALLGHCEAEGITHALLLGMGGSSLAPEVLRLVNGVSVRSGKKGLDLAILDSTDPRQVQEALDRSGVEKTLYIVSSKSGGTAEVNAYFDFFWDKAVAKLGKKAGDHFIAITDPGTKLEKLASEHKFCHTYLADPMVGGRNSALTAFGLVPAAIIGMDLEKLLANARSLADQCVPEVAFGANPGAMLGVLLGAAWSAGHDKLTVVTDDDWNSFGSWLEQLVAESSGKQGKGIIPIAQEPLTAASGYGSDRLFVYLRSSGKNDGFCTDLRNSGQPVIELAVTNSYDLGGQFYLWEVATAIACAILQVNSFDQPDVQDNKTRTVNKIDGFRKTGQLTDYQPAELVGQTKVFTTKASKLPEANSVNGLILAYLQSVVKKGDFVAINAYLPRNESTNTTLTALRKQILEKFNTATTLGFGPRFLHSTGQLHKGGPDSGVFVEITADTDADLDIPTEGITFGTLERAQAIGDFEALEARGRRVIRVQLSKPDASLLLK
jgi:transaldolase/glucose-6-phosphate isomerase